MKYRKLPIVVEAFQYDGDLKGSDGKYYVPDWAVKAFEEGQIHYEWIDADTMPSELFVKTLEGKMHVSVGDYVIQGVNGEIYPCKPDIFEKTYVSNGDLTIEVSIADTEILKDITRLLDKYAKEIPELYIEASEIYEKHNLADKA